MDRPARPNVTAPAVRPDEPTDEARRADARYRALAETVRAVPWEGDPATDEITYVGPQIEILTGYRVDQWTAAGWRQALHPEDREPVVRTYQENLRQRRDHNLEYRVVTTAGQLIWIRDIISFVRDADGRELARGLMIVIDEEKALERALRENEERYREAERIAKLVHWSVELSPDGQWDKHRFSYSDGAAEMFGLRPDGMWMSNADFIALLVHPDDRALVRGTLIKALAERQPEISLTYRIMRKDGGVRWVVEHIRNRYDESGTRTSAFGIVQDITEQRQRETELAAACLRADLANRAKTQFLATMSHELRTPLNAIIGFSEIMKLEIVGPLGARQYLDYASDIHGSGTFLLAIINELLDLSLIDSGEMKLEESLVQIDKIVASSLSLLQAKADLRGIALRRSVPPDPPPIRADARRIKQALLNLIANALKFTPSGGTVTVGVVFSDAGVTVSVTDTGIGIAGADLERVTKPFVQVENWHARQHEGAGLGLAIAKGICELHDGTLSLESEVGCGTIVRICLPADRIEGPAAR